MSERTPVDLSPPPRIIEPMPEDLMTTAEVARLVRRTPRTIRNWISQGLLTPLPLPGPRLFRRSDVEQLLGYAGQIQSISTISSLDRCSED